MGSFPEGEAIDTWRRAGDVEVNEHTGEIRPLSDGDDPPDDGGSHVREPRRPGGPLPAVAVDLELVKADAEDH